MSKSYTFSLVKKASGKGGDKYSCKDDPKFVLYFPQYVSRNSNEDTIKTLVVNVCSEEQDELPEKKRRKTEESDSEDSD